MDWSKKVWKFIEGRGEDKYEFCITFPIFVSLFNKYHLSSSSLSCLFYVRLTVEIFLSLLSRICQSPFSIKFSPNLPHCSLIGIPTISLNLLIKSRIFYLQFRTLSFYRCQSYRSCCCSYVTVYVYYTDVWSRISNAGFIMPKREADRETERKRETESGEDGDARVSGLFSTQRV